MTGEYVAIPLPCNNLFDPTHASLRDGPITRRLGHLGGLSQIIERCP